MSRYKGNTSVELRKPQKSKFDLSHQKKLSTRMGRLTPILCQEAIPGDTFRGSSEVLLRLAPLLAPIYDEIILYVHYFFVPNRLMWTDWEKFITGGRLGVGVDPLVAPIPPYVKMEDYKDEGLDTESSLGDYLGVPVNWPGVAADYSGQGRNLEILPFLAYQWINENYYRDRNFVDDTWVEPLLSGDHSIDIVEITQLHTRDWMKDYFTAALPFTQRGVEVLMPLAGTGEVTYLDQSIIREENDSWSALLRSEVIGAGPDSALVAGPASTLTGPARIENIDEVQLTSSSVSINDLRSANALQVWLERNAVAGSRYTESIQAHFAVRPQDYRLQRPEYIGGGRIPVRISEVVNTAFSQNQDDETIPAGNMAGHGVTYGNTNNFRYFCTEHGFIMGIMSIMSKPSYHQGLPRMFRRRTFLDYPWPTFAKLGEQRVDKLELFLNAANAAEDANGEVPLFGYQSRYSDWKQGYTTNHGAFHSTLMFWTLCREFATSPSLGDAFVSFEDAIQDRIFAVSGDDNFWCYISNNVSVVRSLPYFGTPTL